MDYSIVKILIVEDDVIAQMALTKMLEEMGFKDIFRANNYEDALNIYHKEKPLINILDIYLKGDKTGIDLAQGIDNKVIFISASSDSSTYKNLAGTNYNYFLHKPYNFDNIEKTIKELLKSV